MEIAGSADAGEVVVEIIFLAVSQDQSPFNKLSAAQRRYFEIVEWLPPSSEGGGADDAGGGADARDRGPDPNSLPPPAATSPPSVPAFAFVAS